MQGAYLTEAVVCVEEGHAGNLGRVLNAHVGQTNGDVVEALRIRISASIEEVS